MALQKEINMLECSTRMNYPKAYHKPINMSINIHKEEVTIQIGVYAHKKAREFAKRGEEVDFIDQYKKIFKFKDFDLSKEKLFKSIYKCLKGIEEFADAKDI